MTGFVFNHLWLKLSFSLSTNKILNVAKTEVILLKTKPRVLRIINFAPFNAHTTPLYKFGIFWSLLICCMFMSNCLKIDSFSTFTENFQLASVVHSNNTRPARNGLSFVPDYNLVRFGRKAIIHSTILRWNHLQDKLK